MVGAIGMPYMEVNWFHESGYWLLLWNVFTQTQYSFNAENVDSVIETS